MSVKFVIDSASDILPREAEALGIVHIPLKVIFGNEEYTDGVKLTHEEFYEKLTSSKALPTTCQAPPSDFADRFRSIVESGDTVVAITISSKLSGTYQSAVIAAEDFPGKVFVVDSLNATIGERVLLKRGLELAEQGMEAAQIAQVLDEEKHSIRVMAVIDTLEYLKKGGRISATVAFAGGLLGIKPAIEVKDGEVVMAGTARGTAKCHALLTELIETYGGINWERPVDFVYSGSDEQLRSYISTRPDLQAREPLPCHSLGCAIGTHVGPGAYGVAFFQK